MQVVAWGGEPAACCAGRGTGGGIGTRKVRRNAARHTRVHARREEAKVGTARVRALGAADCPPPHRVRARVHDCVRRKWSAPPL